MWKVNKINSFIKIDKNYLLVALRDAACQQLDAFAGLRAGLLSKPEPT